MGDTPDIETLCKKGRRCVRQADYAGAAVLYKQALEIDEKRADVHDGLATACFMANDYEGAVEHFTRVTQLDPRRGNALINLGAVYNRMGNHQKAVDVLRRGIQKEKNCSQGYYNLGLAHRRLKQLSMAVSAYREAIRLDPEMAEAHQNLANVYFEMGNHQQALLHYRTALSINPDFERAKRGLAKAEHAVTQARQAFSPFGRLVDTAAPAPKSATMVARELTREERIEDRTAIRATAEAIETTGRTFLAQIREELVAALLALDRAVAQGTDAPTTLTKSHADYQAAINRCAELRKRLKRKVLELRAHEELMNTPSLEPGK